MPKKVNLLPNIRIDKIDLEDCSQDYTQDNGKFFNKQFILNNLATISDGFRVEIADQTTAPGEFTVYNGLAFDKDGQIVANEDEFDSSLTRTLSANATYYVEVEFSSGESDTDSRAFWDADYDNGSDPSGDERPTGREIDDNVATRLTPSWRVVTPISTTGFQSTTNLDSVRVPVAVITRSGGVITGATTTVLKTVLYGAHTIGTTTLRVLDSRLLPESFTATVGAESVTVTANDRENGKLTLSAGLANIHDSGERVIETTGGAAVFLAERTLQYADVTSGTKDQRPRMWQASEEKGYLFSQDPYTATGRSDVQVRKLKEYVDFLAAQLREVKFGALQRTDLGKTAPPNTFSEEPRYFDASGGLLGARACTVSIGDGVVSWGDFNVEQEGDALDTFNAAIAALPTSGGIIFLKNSDNPYSILGTITPDRDVIIIGETPSGVEIVANAADPAFTLDSSLYFGLENIKVSRDAGATSDAAIVVSPGSATKFNLLNCTIDGLYSEDPSLGSFTRCTFNGTDTSGNRHAVSGTFDGAAFRECTFICNNVANATALSLGAASGNVSFYDCYFSLSGTNPTNLTSVLGSSCTFNKCSYIGDATSVYLDGNSGVTISDCVFTLTAKNVGIFVGDTTLCSRIVVSNCRFTQIGAPAVTTTKAVYLRRVSFSTVENCYFEDVDTCIELGESVESITLFNLILDTPTAARGIYGIHAISGSVFGKSTISGCHFNDLDATFITECGGISLDLTSEITISDCSITSVGTDSISGGFGIRFVDDATDVCISNCSIVDVRGSTSASGVFFNQVTCTDIGIDDCVFRAIGNTVGISRGIWLDTVVPVNVSITNNQFNDVGPTTDTQATAGIYIDGDVTSQVTNNIAIIGNTFNDINSTNPAFDSAGIVVLNTGDHLVISNNNVAIADANVNGIFVLSAAGNSRLTEVIIANNNVGSTTGMYNGIALDPGSGDSVDSRYVISGNTVKNFTAGQTGIKASGSGGNKNLIINGNSCYSYAAGADVTGIRVTGFDKFSVTGNVVNILDNTSGAASGIAVDLSTQGTISGNQVSLNDTATGWNIELAIDCSEIMISGNQLVIGNTHDRGISAPDETFIAGNMITGSSTFAIVLAGTSRASAIKFPGNTPSDDPTAFGEIGLNWSGT